MGAVRVLVHGGVADLAADLAKIPPAAAKDMRATVRRGIAVGKSVARDNARRTSGTHGGPPNGHFVNAITSEMNSNGGAFGVSTYSGEWGPDAAKPQGNMEFEEGSRNQPPHRAIAKSGDTVIPAFRGEVSRLPGKWFWM